MPDVFISYRREDAGSAGRMADWLGTHFGSDRVFLDVSRIRGGEDFPDVIEQAIRDCRALVAVVTPRWSEGLHDPADWVRRELAIALAADKPIVPVLLEGAAPPDRSVLPEELGELGDRNALTLSSADFRDDVGRLIEALERVGAEPAARDVLPDVPKSARVERRAGWDAAEEPGRARERLVAALGNHGIRVVGESGDDLRLSGGSKWKARILGSITGPESRLPASGLLRIRDRGAAVTIEVLLQEDWGVGVLAGVGGRYESHFDKVIADLRRVTAR